MRQIDKLTQPCNLDDDVREDRTLAENINNKPKREKWDLVIKLTTPFVQSYMIATVKSESRAVESASAENL